MAKSRTKNLEGWKTCLIENNGRKHGGKLWEKDSERPCKLIHSCFLPPKSCAESMAMYLDAGSSA